MASVFKRGGKNNRHGYYYIAWKDASGQWQRRCSGTTDKEAAQQLANKLETEAMRRRDGIIDAVAERLAIEGRRPLEEHLKDFEAKMSAAQRTGRHVTDTMRLVRDVIKFAGWKTACEVSADGAARFAESQRNEGRSARTIQSYLVATKSFTRWLTHGGKLAADPMVGLKRPSPATDRRHERRALLPDEWPRLEAATRDGAERYGMAGTERALLYRLAIETGLRANELRSLTRASLRLDDAQPCVVVAPRSTKNRKDARQFIRPAMAEALRTLAATKAPAARLFDLPHACNLVKLLRFDLSAARRAWLKEAKDDSAERLRREQSDFLTVRNHAGHIFDFHSLRHTCGAWLSMSGAHPKVVQEVMRHSTITLTLDTYGHLFPGQQTNALERLGELVEACMDGTPAESAEPLRATGTEGEVAHNHKHKGKHKTDGATRRPLASGGEAIATGEAPGPNENALRRGTCGDTRRKAASGGEVVRAGIEPATHGFSVLTQGPEFPQETDHSNPSAQLQAQSPPELAQFDPDLAAILAAWPSLPEPIKAGIRAMIQAAGK